MEVMGPVLRGTRHYCLNRMLVWRPPLGSLLVPNSIDLPTADFRPPIKSLRLVLTSMRVLQDNLKDGTVIPGHLKGVTQSQSDSALIKITYQTTWMRFPGKDGSSLKPGDSEVHICEGGHRDAPNLRQGHNLAHLVVQAITAPVAVVPEEIEQPPLVLHRKCGMHLRRNSVEFLRLGRSPDIARPNA